MEYRKYQHIERFGEPAVKGIENGECYVFPKIDGTNASVWLDSEGNVKAGSRKRELSLEEDNGKFYRTISKDENIKNYLLKHPNHRLYGEFLIPHTIRTYKEEAWRIFYVIDVCEENEDEEKTFRYLPYKEYQPLLEEFNLIYIKPIRIITNGNFYLYAKELDNNHYLMKNETDIGEGIVIKNYNYFNRDGEQIWAKIVAAEFNEQRNYKRAVKQKNNYNVIELEILQNYITEAFIEKEYAKMLNEGTEWSKKQIPVLFERVYSELIKEEIWNIINKYNCPTINFKMLYIMIVEKVKQVLPELFKKDEAK